MNVMTKPAFRQESMRIAGRLVATDDVIEVFNPYTNEVVGTVPAGRPEHVQEAFAKALPKWHRLDVPEAYVRACVVNGCRRIQRRRSLMRRTSQPRVDVAAGLEHDHIADAVRRLPSPQREAVVLRYYLQATDPEIAQALHLPLGTVKSTVSRALTQLREAVER